MTATVSHGQARWEGTDRWFAGERVYDPEHRPRHYVERIVGQPSDGFATIEEVMAWLADRGLIVLRDDPEDGPFWTGWGDPYCAVSSTRNDPWGSA